MKKIRFISGIDTDSGKSIITGLIAKYLQEKGEKVITQKMAQTGCVDVSEDILTHRKIMGIDLQEVDKKGLTCPYIFPYPASPHLSASLVNQEIDIRKIETATNELAKKYDYLLLEGVGGLHVPITLDYSLLDYLEEKKYPLILVTSGKLGSINHTLLSLEMAWRRNIPVVGLVYNCFPKGSEIIEQDSIKVFQKYLNKFYPKASIIETPIIKNENYPIIDFDKFFM